MSCCQETTCVQVYINDCVNKIVTPLVADMAGLWRVMVEFNGSWIRRLMQFANGDKIEIDNVFNNNYKHLVQIFRPDGTLFNDTCYNFDMSLVLDTLPLNIPVTTDTSFVFKDNPDYDAGDGTPGNPYELQTGVTVAIPMLYDAVAEIGYVVHQPISYNLGMEYIAYNRNSVTFQRGDNNTFNNGDTMTISYEKMAD